MMTLPQEGSSMIGRNDGTWCRVGTAIHKQPLYQYTVPISETCSFTVKLGAVKRRADGRWNYWRWNTWAHRQWVGGVQGVASNHMGAVAQVMKGWD
jgi:hypothetical protein